MDNHHSSAKSAADIVSLFATVGSFLEMLTPMFGLIGAVWTIMRISEMVTGKTFHELIRRKKPQDAIDQ
jgi:hypothetical protein